MAGCTSHGAPDRDSAQQLTCAEAAYAESLYRRWSYSMSCGASICLSQDKVSARSLGRLS
jgi:hypothetical protein